MVKIGTFDISRSTFRDCTEFFDSSLSLAAWQTLKALSQSFGHHTRHGFPCFSSDGRGETVSLRIFDVERSHGFLSVLTSNFYHSTRDSMLMNTFRTLTLA
jgi:hypothetical protein